MNGWSNGDVVNFVDRKHNELIKEIEELKKLIRELNINSTDRVYKNNENDK